MAKIISPTFPGGVWDGITENPDRRTREVNVPPNAQDWDRIVSELIACQTAYLAGGADGAAGAVWRVGAGAPSNGTGIDGDFYLRTSNGDVYLRATGTYSVVANIKGADGAAGSAGAAGSVWRSGSGAPSDGTGVNGDFYLRTSNGDVYTRAAGTYSVTGNIKGATGDAGAAGAAGAGGNVAEVAATASDNHVLFGTSAFEDINSMSSTITVGSTGLIICQFQAVVQPKVAAWQILNLRFILDNTTAGGEQPVHYEETNPTNSRRLNYSIFYAFTGVSAGSHTVKAQIGNSGSSQTWEVFNRRMRLLY